MEFLRFGRQLWCVLNTPLMLCCPQVKMKLEVVFNFCATTYHCVGLSFPSIRGAEMAFSEACTKACIAGRNWPTCGRPPSSGRAEEALGGCPREAACSASVKRWGNNFHGHIFSLGLRWMPIKSKGEYVGVTKSRFMCFRTAVTFPRETCEEDRFSIYIK